MDDSLKEKMKEYLEKDMFLELHITLEKNMENLLGTRRLFDEWFWTKTPKEQELHNKAYEFEEEYFSDMRLIDYEDEISAVKMKDGSEWVDTYFGDIDRFGLTIDNCWRFKFVDEDEFWGCTYYYEKLVEISNQANVDITLIHEMIHIYDSLLKSCGLNDFVLIRLYDELFPKIEKLREKINLDNHSLVKEHSVLFMLKSLKLDLEFGYKLGTIYSYGRTELYEES